MKYGQFMTIVDVYLIIFLLVMGIAYLLRGRKRHLLASIGYFGYAVFWMVLTALYFTKEANPTNGIFTLMGVAVFGYLGYHEWENYSKDEYLLSMEWAAKATAVTALIYFAIDKIKWVSGGIIYATAWQTVKIIQWIGYQPFGAEVSLGELLFDSDMIRVPIEDGGITIILACTGIQAIVLFFIFNVFLKAPLKRKFYGFLITVPIIYLANQFRNVAIIYLNAEDISFGTGMDAFDLAHNWLGKIFSFIVLIGIVIYSFKILPEALENLFDLIDLHKRDKGKIVKGRFKFPKKKDGGTKSEVHDNVDADDDKED